MQNAPRINEFFMEALHIELENARKQSNLERSSKLNQIAEIMEKLSTPPETELIEMLLSVESEEERLKVLEQNPDMVTPELVELMGALAAQSEADESQPAEIKLQVQETFSTVLRYAMKNKITN